MNGMFVVLMLPRKEIFVTSLLTICVSVQAVMVSILLASTVQIFVYRWWTSDA